MSNEDYAKGYNDGFRAGLEAGKGINSPSTPYNPPDLWPKYHKPGHTCQVCGMFFESGKAYGYCCMNYNCPSKVTCSSNVSYTFGGTKIT